MYAYCANNPINYTDPSGHNGQSLITGICGEVLFFAKAISPTPVKVALTTIVTCFHIAAVLYDYNSNMKKAKNKYGTTSNSYKQIKKFNRFMLAISTVSIVVDSFLGKLSKKYKDRIAVAAIKVFCDYGVIRGLN